MELDEQLELTRRDELMASAVGLAGSLLEKDSKRDSFLERLLEAALARAIAQTAPGAKVEQTGHALTAVPGWDIELGNFDLQVRLAGEEQPSILIETKIDDVGDQLWDMFKLTSVPLIPAPSPATWSLLLSDPTGTGAVIASSSTPPSHWFGDGAPGKCS